MTPIFRSASVRCSRPGCNAPSVITVRRITRAVASYCMGHADGHASEEGTVLLWLAAGRCLCARCWRVVLPRTREDHFDAAGLPCRRPVPAALRDPELVGV